MMIGRIRGPRETSFVGDQPFRKFVLKPTHWQNWGVADSSVLFLWQVAATCSNLLRYLSVLTVTALPVTGSSKKNGQKKESLRHAVSQISTADCSCAAQLRSEFSKLRLCANFKLKFYLSFGICFITLSFTVW